uniref:RPN7 domain-containing protein n=1 Tax=Heterorhabditis bacteriophora TaxID=37862 RepID=A0A1I7WQL0_HETBA
MSSDAVPDPEDVMEAEYHDQIADEPIDDFDVDVGNANLEEDFHDREGTPIPEEAVPAANHIGEIDIINYADVRTDSIISVCNPAVDIEFLCQTYTDHALLSRLQFICDHCPPLKRDAIIGMINELHKNSLNVARYTALHAQLEFLEKHPHEQCHLEAPVCDQLWVDHTTVKASGRLDFLLSEYKKQKDEGVKESTRRAMEDLFQHYLAVGQMWLNWMEASIYVGEWQRVDTIYTQAERSMKDAEESESVH